MPSPFQSAAARRRFYRRSICAVLLGTFVITATGVPLPVGTHKNESGKSGELFPCATSSCGCRTANQCWRSCCCHSLAERIAWARQHGVQPPAFALAQAKSAGIDATCCATTTAKNKPSCCETRGVASHTKPSRNCCSSHYESESAEPSDIHVVGWQSLKCKGHSMNWLAAVPTLIVGSDALSCNLQFFAWLTPLASDQAVGNDEIPATPPPELA